MGEFNSPTPELDKRIPGTIKLVQLFWGEVPESGERFQEKTWSWYLNLRLSFHLYYSFV